VQLSSEKKTADVIAIDDLAERLFHFVKAVVMPADDDERFSLMEDHSLTFGQVKALIHLSRAEEPLSCGAIAESIGASAPVASRSLDALVQKGFATRTECENDRRVRLFSTTEAGDDLAAKLVALRRAQVESFAAEIPDELAARLYELLRDLEDEGLIDASCGGRS
jgi:DNA-binding MarR family transcriptional regulator